MKHATYINARSLNKRMSMDKNRTISYEEQVWNSSLVQYLLSQKLDESSFDDHE